MGSQRTFVQTDEGFTGGSMNHKEIERWYRLRNLKRAAQILVLASVALLIAGYAISRVLTERHPVINDTPTSSDELRVENFSYSHRGAYPVELNARVGLLPASLDKGKLSFLSVTARSKDGKKLTLTAEKGEFDKKKELVTASGNVKVQYEDLVLTTDQVSYSMDKGKVWTESAVKLTGRQFHLEGGGLTLWVESEKFSLENEVQVTFYGRNWKLSQGKPAPDEKERLQ